MGSMLDDTRNLQIGEVKMYIVSDTYVVMWKHAWHQYDFGTFFELTDALNCVRLHMSYEMDIALDRISRPIAGSV